ncbi:MAG: DUF309 domain-containing protein [Planctomyces sp.]|nr:DUF309 domain-containing protein [Planctomyces sp.]
MSSGEVKPSAPQGYAEFPAYTHTPGVTPHPLRDPAGHSHGRHEPPPSGFEPRDWMDCEAFVRGLRLFNRGYYWEAHEAWEAVWIAAGRTGPVADALKGLIKWAAAGVKAREGRPEGVRRHLARARELLLSALAQGVDDAFAGQSLTELTEVVARQATQATSAPPMQHGEPVVLWGAPLRLPEAGPPGDSKVRCDRS